MAVLASDISVQAQPGSVKSPDEFNAMPSEYQDLAKHMMLLRTEIEINSADEYAKVFYTLAPDSYEKLVCCERAGEELAHYRLCATALADLGVDTEPMLGRQIDERALFPSELMRDLNTWMERAFYSFLGEAAGLDHMIELSECSYEPFARIFRESIIPDEHTHVAHGYRIIKEACATDSGRIEAQVALNRSWPVVLDLFGSSESRRSPEMIRWGLRKTTNNELRQKFMKKTRPRLAALGLKAPDDIIGRKFF